MASYKPAERPFERKTMSPEELNFLRRKFRKRKFGSTMMMICFSLLSLAFIFASTMIIFFVAVVPFTIWATLIFWKKSKANNEHLKKDLTYAKKLIYNTVLDDKIEEDVSPYRTWIVTAEGKFHVSSTTYFELQKGDRIELVLSEYSKTLIDFKKAD